MSSPEIQAQEQPAVTQETKSNDKEYNFRAQQAKYERMLAEERQAREIAEKKLQEKLQTSSDDEEDDSQPYVDNKKLNKKLAKFSENTKQYTKSEIQENIRQALHEERKQNWMKQNPDFYDTLQHAEKLALKNPGLADRILQMPDSFERQQLVYENIKALGLDKPEQKQSSIQEKVDANRRSPYYQPSGVGAAPYSQVGDFSEQGQKQSYQKMKDLQKKMRI
jgi:actin-related protein